MADTKVRRANRPSRIDLKYIGDDLRSENVR